MTEYTISFNNIILPIFLVVFIEFFRFKNYYGTYIVLTSTKKYIFMVTSEIDPVCD